MEPTRSSPTVATAFSASLTPAHSHVIRITVAFSTGSSRMSRYSGELGGLLVRRIRIRAGLQASGRHVDESRLPALDERRKAISQLPPRRGSLLCPIKP